ncbi:MAG: septum formation initiator family protein [Rubrobacter sp.]|nr:septum formation initiator family protein [Rubrobacter sp.]
MLYAAFIGLLLASYMVPIQDILSGHSEIPKLEERLDEAEARVAAERREAEALQTPEGIERAARERYGMVMPGEKVYIIEDE